MKTTTSKSSVISQILFSVVAVAIGYLLLFNKAVLVPTLCQIMCGGLIVVGVVSIVSFFLTGDYKRIDRYGFALGTLLILLGCIGLLRSAEVSANFEMYAGLMSLVLGVLTLQGTVQVKVLNYAAWMLDLVLTLVCLAGAFCVLSGITAVTNLVQGFPSWLLLISGASCLFSLFVTWICIMLAGRREKKAQKEAEAKKEEAAREEAARKEAAAREEAARKEAEAREAAARKEAQAQQAAAHSDVMSGDYRPVDSQPSMPAETHHTGTDTVSPAQTDLPPVEKPELTFEPAESHHTDFQAGGSDNA